MAPREANGNRSIEEQSLKVDHAPAETTLTPSYSSGRFSRGSGDRKPLCDDSSELTLEFAVFDPLKAEQQLLVEHCGDPAQSSELRHVRPVLEAGDGGMGGIGGGRHLLLSEPELETSLTEMGGDCIGLPELADPRVFVASISIRAASARTARRGPLSRLSDGAVSVSFHEVQLIKAGKFPSS